MMLSAKAICPSLILALFAPLGHLRKAAELRGVTETEIRIGQTMPYSGPLSAFGALGKAEVAYFNAANDRGGINGRKVKLISLDDGYVPSKTVEQTRRLVESDEVALIFSSLGTAQNSAIAKYLQSKNVPQLFLASGASKFGDVLQFPQALMGIQAPFRHEARLYARHIFGKLGRAKIAVLAQNGVGKYLCSPPLPSGMEARRVKTRRSRGFNASRQPGPEGRRPYAREQDAMSVLAPDS